MENDKKIKYIKFACTFVLVIVLSILGYYYDVLFLEGDEVETLSLVDNNNVNIENEDLRIHFIDVGQGDSIIIEQKGHFMLIDAGTNECEDDLITYINSLNITKFDYVIGTHAHEDHIGSMDAVIDNYVVDKVLFSKHTTTTKTFENFVNAVKSKGLKLTSPEVGEEFDFQDSKFIVLAPNSKNYDDINNYSIVIKFIYKETSYLFTGDVESLSEQEILDKNLDVKADVLKVGHHGSKSSTSKKFLDAVNPKYAVISCGVGNDYGHPKSVIMNRLQKANIICYRTDESGTIVLTSDGKNIKFNKNPGSYNGNN